MVLVELTWHWWKPSLHMALVEPIGKSSFLENSLFLGDLGPDHVTGRLGWLEWVESKEIAAWDDWDQLPSNSRSSSTPAACHLADECSILQQQAQGARGGEWPYGRTVISHFRVPNLRQHSGWL